MKYLKVSLLFLFAAAIIVPFGFTRSVEGQAASEAPTHDMNATTPSTTVSDVFNQIDYDGDGDSDALGDCDVKFSDKGWCQCLDDSRSDVDARFSGQACRQFSCERSC